MTSASGGVAYWAHIGGFLAGLLVGPLLVRSEQRYRPYYADRGDFTGSIQWDAGKVGVQ